MIEVKFDQSGDGPYKSAECYSNGSSWMTDENGWIFILDAEGLSIGAHPKEKVDSVRFYETKAGEDECEA